jgi:hypothetical protein
MVVAVYTEASARILTHVIDQSRASWPGGDITLTTAAFAQKGSHVRACEVSFFKRSDRDLDFTSWHRS